MKKTIGKPERQTPDERTGFYVHEHLTCYLDVRPNGVYVDGKTPKGENVFRRHFGNVHEAIRFIENHQSLFDEKSPLNKSDLTEEKAKQ